MEKEQEEKRVDEEEEEMEGSEYNKAPYGVISLRNETKVIPKLQS